MLWGMTRRDPSSDERKNIYHAHYINTSHTLNPLNSYQNRKGMEGRDSHDVFIKME